MNKSPHILTVSEATAVENAASIELRRYLAMEPKNGAQDVFMCSVSPFLALVGPNMIGKSPIGAARQIMHATHVVPHPFRGRIPFLLPSSHRGRFMLYVVLGITKEQANDAAWGTLLEWLPPEFRHKTSTKYRIVLKQFLDEPGRPIPRIVDKPGVIVALRTTEQKRKRQQGSPRIKIVWADEEDGNEGVIDEYQTQIAKVGGWLQLTATPLESLEKGGSTVFAQTILDPAYQARHDNERSVMLDDGVQVVFGQRGDQIDGQTGRLMSAEQLAGLDKKYRRESVRRLRVDGVWEPTPDQPYYDEQPVALIMAQVRSPDAMQPTRGYVYERDGNFEFVPDESSGLRVYEAPELYGAYIIGADFAQGNASDWTACVVWDRRRSCVSTVYHARADTNLAKVILYDLVHYYRRAWVVIDPDRFGGQAIGYLRDRGYTGRLYRRKTREDDIQQKPLDYGYVFTSRTRAALDERVGEELKRGTLDVRYEPLAREIGLYGYYGREVRGVQAPDHPPAGHDDLQKALGMALKGHDECPMPSRRDQEDAAFSALPGSTGRIARERAKIDRAFAELVRRTGGVYEA